MSFREVCFFREKNIFFCLINKKTFKTFVFYIEVMGGKEKW